ncbi:MAG: DUF3330 domain-containing protein [Burkholderiales bacterium]|nr:hypothetical protein [Rhodocyclaceae bacterium]MCZ2419725.1 DUF3330 domain-containing protein [Burkholderiales bacterium]
MTYKPISPSGKPMISCAACRKEVPVSAAFTPEGAEYVGHFCGLECYQQLVVEAKRRGEGTPGGGA